MKKNRQGISTRGTKTDERGVERGRKWEGGRIEIEGGGILAKKGSDIR